MLFWYAGIAVFLVYATLGRRRVDYRMIVLGAVVPGVVDWVAHATGAQTPDGRGVAHSFLSPVAVAFVVLLFTRGTVRLSLFGVAVGWLFHLVADGMWQYPRTFLWPAFGTELTFAGADAGAAGLFEEPRRHLATLVKELAGLGILVWFWFAFRLGDADRRKRFARDGLLRA